jgi:hypothetical protein
MSKTKFTKPPMTDEERNKKAEAFINLTDERIDQQKIQSDNVRHKKEPTKAIIVRAPKSFWEDIHEIVALTGLTMNAVCLELLRPSIKKKLKELKEE